VIPDGSRYHKHAAKYYCLPKIFFGDDVKEVFKQRFAALKAIAEEQGFTMA